MTSLSLRAETRILSCFIFLHDSHLTNNTKLFEPHCCCALITIDYTGAQVHMYACTFSLLDAIETHAACIDAATSSCADDARDGRAWGRFIIDHLGTVPDSTYAAPLVDDILSRLI
jgi:hypothetical protein